MENAQLVRWLIEVENHVTPSAVHVCDGSERERSELEAQMFEMARSSSWIRTATRGASCIAAIPAMSPARNI